MADKIEKQAKVLTKQIIKMTLDNQKEGLNIFNEFVVFLKTEKVYCIFTNVGKNRKKEKEQQAEYDTVLETARAIHLPIKSNNKMLNTVEFNMYKFTKSNISGIQNRVNQSLFDRCTPDEIIEKERNDLKAQTENRIQLIKNAKSKIKQIRSGNNGYSLFKEVCPIIYKDEKYNIKANDDIFAILKLLVRYNFENKGLEFLFADEFCETQDVSGLYNYHIWQNSRSRKCWLLKAKLKVVDQESGKVLIDNISGEDKNFWVSEYKKNSDEVIIGDKEQINIVKFLQFCTQKLQSQEYGVKAFQTDNLDINNLPRDVIIDMHIEWCKISNTYQSIDKNEIDNYIFDNIVERGALEFYSTDIKNIKVRLNVNTDLNSYTIKRASLVQIKR